VFDPKRSTQTEFESEAPNTVSAPMGATRITYIEGGGGCRKFTYVYAV
jgi:hypothetical protein